MPAMRELANSSIDAGSFSPALAAGALDSCLAYFDRPDSNGQSDAGLKCRLAAALLHQNRRDEAVLLLRDELNKWQGTSIRDRIQKNINLLTLEGKPVPELDVSHGVGKRKPLPLSAHRGHPVLLFLWAHWCPDCKAEVKIINKLMAAYGPRGLVVVAPTQHYGYVAGGQDASPAVETRYIERVFAKEYAGLGSVEAPLSEANLSKFGVSTTPTMVLVDGQGIVRTYNPGAMSYEALAAKIEPLLAANKPAMPKR